MIKELYIKPSKYEAVMMRQAVENKAAKILTAATETTNNFSWKRFAAVFSILLYPVICFFFRYEIHSIFSSTPDPSGLWLFLDCTLFTILTCIFIFMLALVVAVSGGIFIGTYFWVFKGAEWQFGGPD